ncbi:MAG: hypothetical protein RL701_3941 [Pseudomonadota bacterium]
MRACTYCRKILAAADAVCPDDQSPGVPVLIEPLPVELQARFGAFEPYAVGATGTLWRGADEAMHVDVVLKVLSAAQSSSAAERARSRRELRKLLSFTHPHLPPVYDEGEAAGRIWFARELVPGDTLALRLRRAGKLSVSDALAVTAQLASALDTLHRQGLSHRDVKPGHVVFRVDLVTGGAHEIVQLIDACVACPGALNSAPYAAPEIAAGAPANFRSDLYALGCLSYELLIGSAPFQEVAAEAVLAAAQTRNPAVLNELAAPVRALLASMLAKDPRRRPFSAQQVRRALDPYIPAWVPPAPGGAGANTRSLSGSGAPSASSAPDLQHSEPPFGSSSTSSARNSRSAPRPDTTRPDATMELGPDDLELAELTGQVNPVAAIGGRLSSGTGFNKPMGSAATSGKPKPLTGRVTHQPKTAGASPPKPSGRDSAPPRVPTDRRSVPAVFKERPNPTEEIQLFELESVATESVSVEAIIQIAGSHTTTLGSGSGGGRGSEDDDAPTVAIDTQSAVATEEQPNSALPSAAATALDAQADKRDDDGKVADSHVRSRNITQFGVGELTPALAAATASSQVATVHAEPDPTAAAETSAREPDETENHELAGAQDPEREDSGAWTASDAAAAENARIADPASQASAEPAAEAEPGPPRAATPATGPYAHENYEPDAAFYAAADTGMRSSFSPIREGDPDLRASQRPPLSRRPVLLMWGAGALVLLLISVRLVAGPGPERKASTVPEPVAVATPADEPSPPTAAADEPAVATDQPPTAAEEQPLAAAAEPPSTASAEQPAALPVAPVQPVAAAALESAPTKAEPAAVAEASATPATDTKTMRASDASKGMARDPGGLGRGRLRTRAEVVEVAESDFKGRGRQLYQEGKFREAAEAYQAAATHSATDASAFAGLGASWLAAGEAARAVTAYERAVQLKPTVSGFQAALGRAYLAKGDRNKASSAYAHALALDPTNQAARNGVLAVQSKP